MIKPSLAPFVPNAPDLIEACQDYLDYIDSPEYHEDGVDDYEHAIFEAALQAVFGRDVFDFVNWIGDERDRKWEDAQKAADLANED